MILITRRILIGIGLTALTIATGYGCYKVAKDSSPWFVKMYNRFLRPGINTVSHGISNVKGKIIHRFKTNNPVEEVS